MSLLRFFFADPMAMARCIFVHKNISHNPPKSDSGCIKNPKRSEFISWFSVAKTLLAPYPELYSHTEPFALKRKRVIVFWLDYNLTSLVDKSIFLSNLDGR